MAFKLFKAADRIAFVRVGMQLMVSVVERERPEAMGRWQLISGEVQRVCLLAVQGVAVGRMFEVVVLGFLFAIDERVGFGNGSARPVVIAKRVDGRMHTNDLHATILALMGLDHEVLTYPYAGRQFRLTDVAGVVNREIFA